MKFLTFISWFSIFRTTGFTKFGWKTDLVTQSSVCFTRNTGEGHTAFKMIAKAENAGQVMLASLKTVHFEKISDVCNENKTYVSMTSMCS